MVHALRDAMHSLKKTGTDWVSAKGMDPKSFFEVMGEKFFASFNMEQLLKRTHSWRFERDRGT